MSIGFTGMERRTRGGRSDVCDVPDVLLDDVAAIAACALRCPIVVVSVFDTDRLWLRSEPADGALAQRIGLCGTAIKADYKWQVRNARTDAHTLANPLLAGRAGLRFYVGVPLRGRNGQSLGTLAALDEEPRVIGEEELSILKKLAALVVDMLEMKIDLRLAQRTARATAIG